MHSFVPGTDHKFTSVDLTEGPILPKIASFALPLMLGQIFQNLYNSVDSIVAGNNLGVTALAAVTSCSDISRLLTGFFTGLSVGSGVVFSRYFGAKNDRNLHLSIHTALTFSFLLGFLMMCVGIILSPQLLSLVRCPEDVRPEALLYLRIYLVGILFTSIYNVEAAVLRSVGDSKSPFVILVIASFTNIFLDILFVVVLSMGVEGVGIATIISQLLSVTLVTQKMLRTRDVYRLVPKELRIDPSFLKDIIVIGIPAAIQSGLISFSNLFVQRYVNVFGTAAMAGAGVGKKIDGYVGLVSISFGQATTTYVSQCLGAGKKERARKGIRLVILLNMVIVVLTSVPFYLLAEQLAGLFTSDPETITYAALMIHIIMPCYFIQVLHQIISNTTRGFGKSAVTMLTSIGGIIVCRQIYLAVVMPVFHDIRLVFFGFPLGWLCSLIAELLYYFLVVRKVLLMKPAGQPDHIS